MRIRAGVLLSLWFTLANLSVCSSGCGRYGSNAKAAEVIHLRRDLASSNLLEWRHRDYGLGTDVGGNASGAGYLWYHANVGGRRAAGMTVTSTAHASPAPNSDSVYLWEPADYWNYRSQDIWLRTSVMFPSAATISSVGAAGERPYQPVTGEWNWFLEFHNDSNPLPLCAKEYANIAMDVKTDEAIQAGIAGVKNPRIAVRIMGGNDCAPNIVWVDGPPLRWDHWYEVLLHIRWDSKSGIFEWYLDDFNAPYYSNRKIPTLYTRPHGYVSPSYTTLTLCNYRWHAPWSSTIYLGQLVVGSTKSSVLKAL
jgi:hypothetical protein